MNWDDPILEDMLREWTELFFELSKLNLVEIERCTKPEEAIGNPYLVIFSDGSIEAYGAAAYAVWGTESGKHISRLLISKNRVAPTKVVNIVRLELCGAVLNARLNKFVNEHCRYQFQRTFHIVDSEIVKAMLVKNSYGFNTFAANRIGEIQSLTSVNDWYWTRSENNAADCITRKGSTVEDVQQSSAWISGPPFLQMSVDEWPLEQTTEVTDLPSF